MMLIPRKNNNWDLWEDLFNDPFFSNNDSKVMRTDIKENKDNYDIMIDLPGYEKENIKIDVEDGYLNITAKTNSNSTDDEKGKYVRRERYYGEMSRSFYIGDDVKEEDIKAAFKNGTLSITVPKVDNREISRKKQIEIED